MPESQEIMDYSIGDSPVSLKTDKRSFVRLHRKKEVVIIWDRRESKRLPYHQFLLFDGDSHVLTAESDENGEYHPENGRLPEDWSIDVIGPGPNHPYWGSLDAGEADEELEGAVAEPEPDDDDEDPLDEDA